MFNGAFDDIAITDFTNYGVAYLMDKIYYLAKNSEVIGFEDNKGKYFFAVKDKSTIVYDDSLTSCGSSCKQDFTIFFITTCPSELWLYTQVNNLSFTSDNIDNIVCSVNSIMEIKQTMTMYVTEVNITLSGNINDCEVVKPCCC